MASKALVIGINRYETVSSLRGCVNDARSVARLLGEVYGFDATNVKLVLDTAARRTKIRAMMKWLFEDTRPGDRVAFHFSGHGSRIPDKGGEENDKLDELLCLNDMDFDRPSSYLLDDELAQWTKTCPSGVFLTLFLDCCHSGTGTRKLIPPRAVEAAGQYPRIIEAATSQRVAQRLLAAGPAAPLRTLEALSALTRGVLEADPVDQVYARFIEPPPELEAEVAIRLERAEARGATRPSVEQVPGMNHVLFSACQDHQTAADAFLDGTYQGAFSHQLCRILGELGASADRTTLITRLTRGLAEGGFEQIPRLEAPRLAGPLFSEGKPPATKPTPAEPEPASPRLDTPRPPGPITADAGDGLQLYRELVATYNRLLDLIQPARAGLSHELTTTRAAAQQLVYVHGIGTHRPHYSDDWWNALEPHTPSLQPGTLFHPANAPSGNRREVLWSSIVNPDRAATPELDQSATDEHARQLADQIRDELADRREVEVERALRDLAPESTDSDPATRGVVEESFLGSIDDFSRYMSNREVRNAILERFQQTMLDALRNGSQVVLITHSWGTVVAYEGLRILDTVAGLPSGCVRRFFTLGSALSIPTVRRNLFERLADGRKPRLVTQWYNLDARFDIVGGSLRGRFAVDQDFPDLKPVGMGFLPDPVAAHKSYFQNENLTVNRDILGAKIENP